MDFPVFQHVHQMVGVRFVERHAVVEAEVVQHARGRIDLGVGLRPASLVGVAQVLEQQGVIAWLDADDRVQAGVAQVVEVGRVGAEGVLDDDHGQVGMLAAEAPEPAAGGVAFAVVLGVAVLVDDRLGRQRDDFLEIGMDERGTQHLVGIGDAAAAMVLLQTRRTVDLGGRIIGRSVEGQEVAAVEIDEGLQGLAALQAAEDITEQGPQRVRIDRVQKGPHLRVGGDVVDAVDGAEVVVGIATTPVEGQEGRILEREHGDGGHQGVAEGDFGLPRARIGDFVKPAAELSEERVRGKIFARLPGEGNHGQILSPEC